MKDTLIIGAAILVAIALGTWLMVSGNDVAAPHQQLGAVTYSVLDQGTDAEITEQKNYRIKSAEELSTLWVQMGAEGEAPTVDFSKNHVLAAFDGERPTGGYEVSIASVEDTMEARKVVIVHTQPANSCITTEALTSPYVLVVVPASNATIAREDRTMISNCD